MLAARMPSSVPVGGMRMSVSTTSGAWVSTAASRPVVVPAELDDVDVVLRLEEAGDALAHEKRILGDHHSETHRSSRLVAGAPGHSLLSSTPARV